MVEAGLGVALLPEMAIKAGFLVGSTVIARPLSAPAPRRDMVLVARPSTPRSALLLRLQVLAAAEPHVGMARGARRSRLKVNAAAGRAGRT
jgi:LysR family hydrogen peroxide-inducible transcriptional activator